jgi:hypothetical protein
MRLYFNILPKSYTANPVYKDGGSHNRITAQMHFS